MLVNLHMACIYGSGKNWLATEVRLSASGEGKELAGSRCWARNWDDAAQELVVGLSSLTF